MEIIDVKSSLVGNERAEIWISCQKLPKIDVVSILKPRLDEKHRQNKVKLVFLFIKIVFIISLLNCHIFVVYWH
jgi:hypothetical protein